MFDDRTQDIIMDEMMVEFGGGVRTDEGSLAYNACAKISEKLEEVYGDMDELNDNLLPDTQDESHLISYGSERGVKYSYATAPVVKGVFQQEIELGERLSCNDFIYEVIEQISGFEYKLACETEGVEANANLGELEPVDYIDDYLGGQITELLVAGADDEDIEAYRKKVLATFQSTAFGGNKAYYRQHINDIDGVGGCKPVRRSADSPIVNVYVISNDFNVPSDDLIANIQNLVDPVESSGEGDGIAPICHTVKILAVPAVDVNISCKITFDTGYSISTNQSLIENVIKDYLAELRAGWESLEKNSTIIRISQIEAKILGVEGVLDVTDTTINGASENLILDYMNIAVFGGVTVV